MKKYLIEVENNGITRLTAVSPTDPLNVLKADSPCCVTDFLENVLDMISRDHTDCKTESTPLEYFDSLDLEPSAKIEIIKDVEKFTPFKYKIGQMTANGEILHRCLFGKKNVYYFKDGASFEKNVKTI
jgi:hypothetical protein